ncbi:PGF-CTERM sorting domain-containing protein [Haloarcula sp. JP-L23]|uniref:PGF-CTERM sorting domain-containing protein n=1 Tax=Haloarcula sp. JP-L23 TaxID=2716717 RepID=UPI00140ED22F|nr:PGF-CTERM sorting domain-containing protein [Haloarcula sp. JP-L23]
MRKPYPEIAVVVVLALSGCMTATVDASVDADGTVSTYEVELAMSGTVFDALQRTAENEGYDSVEAYLTDGVNESRMENVTYEQALEGDNVSVRLQFTDWTPGPESGVNATVQNGTLTYEDRTFVTVQENDDVALGDGVAVRYELTMPGDIYESNADIVENRTAVWEYEANEPVEEPIRAQSNAPSSAFGPGFGVTAAVLALLSMAVFARRS